MNRLIFTPLALVVLLAGCSSDDVKTGAAGTAGTAGASGGDIPCDVDKILVDRCQMCHSSPTNFGAPMSMVTRADMLAASPTVPSETVGQNTLARMHDATRPMPQPPNAPVTDAEYATIEAWVNAGMPAATESCGATGGSAGSTSGASGASGASGTAGAGGTGGAAGMAGAAGTTTGGTCVPDQVVKATTPWTIKQNVPDQYVCFGGKIAASPNKRHITEVYVGIDNTAHSHHLCIYDMGSNPVSTTPEACEAGSAIAKGKLLYCWAPGADAETLPPEAGFPLDAGKDTNILIEMHYSNIQGLPDSTDNSSATFCTTDNLRPNDADVMAFGSLDFELKPHAKSTVECKFKMNKAPMGDSIHLFRGWPHMHLLGTAQSTVAMNPGGQGGGEELVGDLGSTNNYSFYNQIGYPLDIDLAKTNVITTKCMYDNTTNATVSAGENTQSEMCYNFVTYYPRMTGLWVWAAPSYESDCTTTVE